MIPANPRANRHVTMAQLKLRRLEEHNKRLKDDLDRPRAKVSETGQAYVKRYLQ
jgi:guanine nucleotide-binding protein subunit gamma